MNERELKALLDRLDEKTEKLAELDTTLKHRDQHMAKVQSLLLGFGDPQASSLTDFIQRMVFEHKRLKITERDHADLISALDEVPLPQEDQESYPAYALRVGDAMRSLSDDKSTLQKDLHEARLEHSNDQSIISGLQQHVSNRDARIAQLEKRESELNSLHDTIEALPGFPMQPEEKYAEYLQRLAENRATLDAAASAHRDKIQGTQEEISEWIRQVEQARNQRDKALEAAQTAQTERDHFRAKWDASLKARDSAQDESRRTRETNDALRGQLTLHSQVIARLMMQPGTDKVFAEIDWSDAARKVLIDARALCGDTSEANVTPKEPQ